MPAESKAIPMMDFTNNLITHTFLLLYIKKIKYLFISGN